MGVAARTTSGADTTQFEALRKMLGHDPGASKALLDGLQEKIAAKESGIDSDYADAKWLAIGQLGATMAMGDSPYFASNFGAGANAGIGALRGAKLNKQKKKLWNCIVY